MLSPAAHPEPHQRVNTWLSSASHLFSQSACCHLAVAGHDVLQRPEYVCQHGAEVTQQAYDDEDVDSENGLAATERWPSEETHTRGFDFSPYRQVLVVRHLADQSVHATRDASR